MDDGGVFGAELLDGVDDLVGLTQFQRAAGGDVDDHATGTMQVDAVEQRRGHGLFGSQTCTVQTRSLADTHHGLARLTHDGLHVSEVDVHQAGHVDDLGNAGHCVVQHVVGALEGIFQGGVLVHHLEELLVEHHDQRIHLADQVLNALVGHALLAAAFVVEGLGDHAHRQDAEFLGDLGDHRRSAGTGALAHAGGDEHHVGAFQGSADVATLGLGRSPARLGIGTGAQTGITQLDGAAGQRTGQRLAVGVHGDELDALHATVDHVVDGIATATTDAHHLDDGAIDICFQHLERHS